MSDQADDSLEWHPPRRLKVFAFDPTTAKAHANRDLRHVTISLPWELDPELEPGPIGEYLEVIDYDPASAQFYRPVDLDDPRILSNGGLDPSEENPQFHQQMVYAVAMNTIATFEEALGRPVLWAPFTEKRKGRWHEEFVQKLRIYPHALREANAYYSPSRKALLFGCFEAGEESKAAVPGTTVFTCLSHDIVVHETVHAILDGRHPHFSESSHPDMLALHEAFSDIVAIFQLFSFPEVLENQIARTRGNLEKQSMLGALAQEFGRSLGRSAALRDALGETDPETGRWMAREPDRYALIRAKGHHARGSVLVAAVFRAFLNVYTSQTADLLRIASGGTGILREGEIDPDLTRRLAQEAAQIARRMLRICIRAMDYVPPVAVSFGDYLRAIITSDHDLFPEDRHGYRTAILEAFAGWGIVPEGMSVVTEKTLLWPTLTQTVADLKSRKALKENDVTIERVMGELGALIMRPHELYEQLRDEGEDTCAVDDRNHKAFIAESETMGKDVEQQANKRLAKVEKLRQTEAGNAEPVGELRQFTRQEAIERNAAELGQTLDRRAEFDTRNFYSKVVWMLTSRRMTPELARTLGLCIDPEVPMSIRRSKITGRPSLHVLPVRRARRMGMRGRLEDELIIELVQTRYGFFAERDQAQADEDPAFAKRRHEFLYRAGCTLLIRAENFSIRRLIRSPYPVQSDIGLEKLRIFRSGNAPPGDSAFHDPLEDGTKTAFADLHRHVHDHGEGW